MTFDASGLTSGLYVVRLRHESGAAHSMPVLFYEVKFRASCYLSSMNLDALFNEIVDLYATDAGVMGCYVSGSASYGGHDR